jgi:hypothetical protein
MRLPLINEHREYQLADFHFYILVLFHPSMTDFYTYVDEGTTSVMVVEQLLVKAEYPDQSPEHSL